MPALKKRNTKKVILKVIAYYGRSERVWIGLVWLRVLTSGEFLGTR
jgi:hypothetical protein